MIWIAIPVVLIIVLALVWNWDWFIPIVQSRASAALGRKVTLAHLHVRPGWVTEVDADDVVIADPPNWKVGDPPLAAIRRLVIRADLWRYIRGGGLVLPLIGLDHPDIYAAETATGDANFRLSTGSSGGGPSPQIGRLQIVDGNAHLVMPKLKSDFRAHIATETASTANDAPADQSDAHAKNVHATADKGAAERPAAENATAEKATANRPGGGQGDGDQATDTQMNTQGTNPQATNPRTATSQGTNTQGTNIQGTNIHATDTQGGDAARIVVTADGTYAGQPIHAHMIGGALLSLRDKANPWPIDMTVENGPTHVALKGTVRDPMALKGADLNLHLSGPDMGLLEPLVGFPIPRTASFDIAGKLDFAGLSNTRFQNFRGHLGNSDVEGLIEEKLDAAEVGKKSIPDVTLDLHSNRVDLADLNGFIGGQPGRSNTKNETPGQREADAKANASKELLPNTPISVPRLTWANIHLHYKGAHIEGRNIPLDDLSVALDVVDGRITVHPVSFGVGKGRLTGDVDLTPESGRTVRAKMDIHMDNLDVSRLMAATHTFQGTGSISGVGAIDSTGDSLATLMANGNGGVKMAMAGGDLSALLVDLTGLQFGNALLSALGVPQKTQVQCFVGDLPMHRGILDFQAFVLDTGEGITNVSGNVDLRDERVDLHMKTEAKHFSIGSLPTNINVTGTFKNPSIRPGAAVAARAGAAVGLGVLFAPLAILPTIQFGTSHEQDARCGDLLRQARAEANGRTLPPPQHPATQEKASTETR